MRKSFSFLAFYFLFLITGNTFAQNQFVINEFMADNVSAVTDPAGEYDDWIEFYNNSSQPYNLKDHYLSDDSTWLNKWQFPDTIVAAFGFLIVWADVDTSQAGIHVKFRLAKSGETLILSDSSGILDKVLFGPQIANNTTGRFPNGLGPFIPMFQTINAVNQKPGNTNIQSGELVINELMAVNDTTSGIVDQNGEPDDWIELYNPGSVQIPLHGVFLSDNYNSPQKWFLPDTFIAAGDYLIIWADLQTKQEGVHSNFRLDRLGERLILSNSDLSVIDSISFGEQFSDTTFGRFPNAFGPFAFLKPTVGAINQTLTTVNILEKSDIQLSQSRNALIIKSSKPLGTLGIYDITGRILWQKKASTSRSSFVNLTNWPAAVYFMIEDGVFVSKFLISPLD